MGAVVLANSDNGAPLAEEILRAVAREYGWPGYLPRERFVRRDEELTYVFHRENGRGALVAGVTIEEEERTAPRLAAGDRLPAERLEEGEVEVGLSAYRALHAAAPDDPAVAEESLSGRGLALMARGHALAAVALLRLATDLYPNSSRAWDALAQAALATGDRGLAISASRQVLAVLPGDWTPTASWRVVYRRRAEELLRGSRSDRPRRR